MWMLLALACTGTPSEGVNDSAGSTCTAAASPTSYVVEHWTDPSPAQAGEPVEFWERVTDQDGCAIEDLQQSHERMVHTLLISADLESFQHLHHEDFQDITADDLRAGTFHFPVTFPTAGETLLVFDFAHQNQWLSQLSSVEVEGAPAQLEAPVFDLSTTATNRGLTATLEWEVAPLAGYESAWSVNITEDDGTEVTDITQWLGADAHCALVSTDLGWAGHTHAWSPGVENMSPGMSMPQVYTGPYLPFHYTFPSAGTHKLWVQLARESAPDDPYVFPFMFEVSP